MQSIVDFFIALHSRFRAVPLRAETPPGSHPLPGPLKEDFLPLGVFQVQGHVAACSASRWASPALPLETTVFDAEDIGSQVCQNHRTIRPRERAKGLTHLCLRVLALQFLVDPPVGYGLIRCFQSLSFKPFHHSPPCPSPSPLPRSPYLVPYSPGLSPFRKFPFHRFFLSGFWSGIRTLSAWIVRSGRGNNSESRWLPILQFRPRSAPGENLAQSEMGLRFSCCSLPRRGALILRGDHQGMMEKKEVTKASTCLSPKTR